jgi:hypothetical protein
MEQKTELGIDIVGVSEGAQLAADDRFREGERIAADHIDGEWPCGLSCAMFAWTMGNP